MRKLLPCPFCGREPRVQEYTNGRRAVVCGNYECPCFMNGNSFETEAEAVAAWNTRAERTCKNETRHIGYGFACSVCEWSAYMPNDYGNDVVFDFNYCPNCGARILP